jgi:hypothetical protein
VAQGTCVSRHLEGKDLTGDLEIEIPFTIGLERHVPHARTWKNRFDQGCDDLFLATWLHRNA